MERNFEDPRINLFFREKGLGNSMGSRKFIGFALEKLFEKTNVYLKCQIVSDSNLSK
jgi:hypothetical protein